MATLYNKDGSIIEYLKKTYNPQTQQNEEEPPGNYFDINAPTEAEQVKQVDSYSSPKFNPEDWDEQYDGAGIIESAEDLDANRIAMQTNGERATRAILGGLVGGVGTAMKDIGYMTSPTSYVNMFNWADIDNANIFTRALVNAGNWLEEGSEKWAPIYEDINPDSVMDQVFKWGTIKGIVNSSLGFMIPGMVPAKLGKLGIKLAGGIGKVGRSIAQANNMTGLGKAALNLERAKSHKRLFDILHPDAAQRIQTGGSLLMSGVGEATWEAIDAHDEELSKFTSALSMGEVEGQEVLRLADNSASKTFAINVAKSVLNYTMLDNFTQITKPGMLKSPGKLWLERHLKEAPQESAEEMIQNVGKQESSYRAMQNYADEYGEDSAIIKSLKESGDYTDNLPDAFGERMAQLFTSTEVLVDGIVGGLSGPVQSTMGNMLRKDILPGTRYRREKKDYTAQQEGIKKRSAMLSDDEVMTAKINEAAATHTVSGAAASTSEVPTAPTPPPASDEGSTKQSKRLFGKSRKQREAEKQKKVEVAETKAKEDKEKMIIRNLERAAIAKEIQRLGGEDTDLMELAKEQVYAGIIAESVAKGTFEALKEDAIKLKDSNSVSRDLYKYILKTESRLKKAEGKLNETDILLNVQKTDGYSTYLTNLNKQLTLAEATIADKKANGIAVTEVEEQYVKDLKSSIEKVTNNLTDLSEEFDILVSNDKQKEIYKEIVLHEEAAKITQQLKDVSTVEELNFVEALYPSVSESAEYAEAKARLSLVDTESTVSPVGKTTITPPSTPTINVNNLNVVDDIQLQKVVGEIFVEATEQEKNEVFEKIKKKSKYLLSKNITQEQYQTMLKEYIADIFTEFEQDKLMNGPEGQALRKEQKKEERRVALGVEILPEDHLERIAEITAQQEALNAELVAINEKDVAGETTEEDTARAKQIGLELSELANFTLKDALKEFNAAAISEAKKNKGKENTTTRGELWAKDIKKDFNKFLAYVEAIMSEDYVRNNYTTLVNIFRGFPGNRKAIIAATYAEHTKASGYITPGDGLANKTNAEVLDNLDKILKSKRLDAKDKTKRLLFNINPVYSMAHLTQSYQKGEREDGTEEIVPDNDAEYNVSPILDPNKYNGDEPLDFTVNWEYGEKETDASSEIHMQSAKGNIVAVRWVEIRKILFGETYLTDKPVLQEGAKEKIEKDYNVVIEDIFDVIPIQITGENEEHLAHMHVPGYINATNTAKENIVPFANKLREERRMVMMAILKGENVTGKIKKKVLGISQDGYSYKGFRMSYSSKWVPSNQGIPSDTVMGVIKSNSIGNNGNINSTDILNYEASIKKLQGVPVALIPIGKINGIMKYHAEPLYSQHVAAEHAAVVEGIIESFLNGDASSDLAKAYGRKGIRIDTLKGAIKALKSIIHITEEVDIDGNPVSFEAVVSDSRGATAKMTLRINENKQKEVAFGIGNPVTVATAASIKGEGLDAMKENLKLLFDNKKFLYNTDLSYLKMDRAKAKGRVPELAIVDGEVIEHESSMNYQATIKARTFTRLAPIKINNSSKIVYTLQNIVEFEMTAGIPSTREGFQEEGIEVEEKKEIIPVESEGLVKAKSIVKQLVVDTKKVQILTKSGKTVPYGTEGEEYTHYIINGEKYDRLTTAIKPEGAEELNTTDESTYIPASIRIGNKVDRLNRDIFNKTIKAHDEYNLIESEEEFNAYVLSVQESPLYKKIQAGELHIAPDGIVLYDEASKTAGTVDLLFYDNEGVFQIYDVKTQRTNGKSEEDLNSNYTSEHFGESNHTKHENQLNGYSIMLQNTYGAKVGKIAILPTSVWYEKGDSKTTGVVARAEIPHTKKDNVKHIKIEEDTIEVPGEINEEGLSMNEVLSRAGMPISTESTVAEIAEALSLTEIEEAAQIYVAIESGDVEFVIPIIQSTGYFKSTHSLKDNLTFFEGLTLEEQNKLENVYLSVPKVTLEAIAEEWSYNQDINEILEWAELMGTYSRAFSKRLSSTKKC